MEESFPIIAWEDSKAAGTVHSRKKRKGRSCTIIETEIEQKKQPRLSRLLRSKRIHSRLCALQEPSSVSSSFYQYSIQKANHTSLWFNNIANIDILNLVKDEDESRQDGNGFEFPVQVVA
jgi:hypothetical protein